MSVNSVCLTGNIVKDAELNQTDSGSWVLNFTIAVKDRYFDRGEWKEYVNFIDLNVFGKRAQSLEHVCLKGTRIAVSGRLRQNTWTSKDERRRSKLVVIVNEVDFLSRIRSNDDEDDYE